MAPGQADRNALPTKEANLYRQMQKHYETKQYKKGLKLADTILKTCPEHGETLSMKALLQSNAGNKEAAMELAKLGVRHNLRSQFCWHVYGMIYQTEKNYEEAAKCYKNALRFEPGDPAILRDLAVIQIHLRDLPGFLQTRQALLEARPNQRQNWLSLALAHHLNGNHEVAVEVLEGFVATLDKKTAEEEPYELSEVLLYSAKILEEAGRHEDALKAIRSAGERAVLRDDLGALEAQGRLLLALGRKEEAQDVFMRLLRRNSDNHAYHHGLRAAKLGDATQSSQALSQEQLSDLVQLYQELQAEFPRSMAVQRLPLDFLAGDAFETAAEQYIKRYLEKGIPSLFSDLSPLFADAAKAPVLHAIAERFETSLAEGRGFDGTSNGHTGAAASPVLEAEPSATSPVQDGGESPLVWARLFRAQALALRGESTAALAAADAALAACPGLPDALSVRSSVLAGAGAAGGAADAADAARQADTADRYANCVAVRALFRAGRVAEAEAAAALFMREGEVTNNLFEMQATWYELEAGRAYAARGEHGRALKMYVRAVGHYAEFQEDQFDFHNYCLRKQTMRSYVDLLRFEDGLFAHGTYVDAAAGAIGTYVLLHDAAEARRAAAAVTAAAATDGTGAAGASNGLSTAEAKRARQRARKEEQRRAKSGAGAAEPAAGGKTPGAKQGAPADDDPDGVALAAVPDPLEQAMSMVRQLERSARGNPVTHALAFEVYLRRGKLLAALRAVRRAARLAPASDPSVHGMTVRLALAAQRQARDVIDAADGAATGADAGAAPAQGAASAALEAGVRALLAPHDGPTAYAAAWADEHGKVSLRHATAALEAAVALEPAGSSPRLAATFVDGAQALLGASTHDDAAEALRLLRDRLAAAEAAETWRRFCVARFPLSDLFASQTVDGDAAGDVAALATGVQALAVN